MNWGRGRRHSKARSNFKHAAEPATPAKTAKTAQAGTPRHEATEGEFNFDGARDLARFAAIAQEEGLILLLRLGPYICGEWGDGAHPDLSAIGHANQATDAESGEPDATRRRTA